MTTDGQLLRDIERDEQWLARRLPSSEPFDTGNVRLRVRIAVGESWLSERLAEEPSESPAQAVRDRVRETLAALAGVRGDGNVTRRRLRVFAASSAPFGVAAALAFLLMARESVLPPNVATDSAVVAAFEESSPADDDWDRSLRELGSRIEAFGTLVGRGASGDAAIGREEAWNWWESSEGDGEGAEGPVGFLWRDRESGA